MIKLEIINKENFEYILKDENNGTHNLMIEFLDTNDEIKVGDYIFLSKELLNPKYDGYSKSYTFGALDSKYGKSNINLDDIDVIKVVKDETEVSLKRLYG